ncbi:LANO_0F04060g1_1 [Lachancea nothofagi CBS 11611]|uniref:LANO_0F04060g1_1 n=1 Tax=Lachancea nothofagi CBS 11611 TaxID=1266666 RepID=A0A1G4K7E7_9SACH|nr:LANO_0F04060g1_1 [Lachancea nothofagi CBS 11611]
MSSYVLRIKDALFKSSLQKSAAPVFPDPIKHFQIKPHERWVIWGSQRSKFMDVLGNKFLSQPPLSLEYGLKHEALPRIECVKFTGVMPTAHISARYEYFKDDFDQTCGKFIKDNSIGSMAVKYEVSNTNRTIDLNLYAYLLRELKLQELENRWAMGLSNGQMRRARLARSLLKEPDLALIDEPFLGLDPTATNIISNFLANYSKSPIAIGLRYQDPIPEWCTHVCCVDANGIVFQGEKESVQDQIISNRKQYGLENATHESKSKYHVKDLVSFHPLAQIPRHEIVELSKGLELRGLSVSYRGEPILKDLHWNVAPNSKWHIRGDNGSGKSTLLSLLTADHPQSWNSRIVENGVPRKTGSTDYFTINKKIGMSSPELHAIFNKSRSANLSVQEALASGFNDNSSNNFLARYESLTDQQRHILEMYADYFDLFPLLNKKYRELSVSDQKLVLFVRSMLKMPEILILDEAFSAMEKNPMNKCHEFLKQWPGIVLVVSHVLDETPRCEHYIRLISPGQYEIGNVPK